MPVRLQSGFSALEAAEARAVLVQSGFSALEAAEARAALVQSGFSALEAVEARAVLVQSGFSALESAVERPGKRKKAGCREIIRRPLLFAIFTPFPLPK